MNSKCLILLSILDASSGVERVVFLSVVAYSRQPCSGDYARNGGEDQPSNGSRRNLGSAAVKRGRVAAQSWGRGRCSESSGPDLASGSAVSWFGAVSCAGAGFLGGTAGVQFQEAGEDFVAGRGRAGGSGRISSSRPKCFVDLVVEEEFAVSRDVAPAIGSEDSAVHSGVEEPELGDVEVVLIGVVEARL